MTYDDDIPAEEPLTDERLVRDVTEEITWDPKIDGKEVSVSARDGAVRLRGTVGSFHAKRAARKAAERVYGVTSVQNDLEVRLLTLDRRDDAVLRGDVLRALALNAHVPATIDAKVEAGVVTLTGTAMWGFQRDEAESVAEKIRGVIAVLDEVELTGPPPKEDDVRAAIERAFRRRARLDGDSVVIKTADGTVTLAGNVSSMAERDDAIAAAYSAPGVRHVDDAMSILY